MKTLATLLTSLIVATWIGVAAIVAVQNFTAVSFKFLAFQSVEIPFGVVLALSAGVGAIATALLPLVFNVSPVQEDDE